MDHYNEYNRRGLSGIVNLGNTCYINSAIQCLSHTLPLTDYFLKKKWENDLNKDFKHNYLFKSWYKLIDALWEDNCTVAPQSLLKQMVQISKDRDLSFGFSSFRQNDIQELLIFLLDNLHESSNKKTFLKSKKRTKSELQWNKFCENNYSIVIDLFYGQISSNILDIDTKKVKSKVFQPMCFFSLPIPALKENQKIISLKDCIDEYCEYEILTEDNKWFNEKTSEYEKVYKKINIERLPKILILCLNRFNNNNRKINTFVDIPLKLDWKDSFELYGICNHMGGSNGGHYTAYCKNNNKNWYKFNDNIVTQIDESNLITESCYCMFYVKK